MKNKHTKFYLLVVLSIIFLFAIYRSYMYLNGNIDLCKTDEKISAVSSIRSNLETYNVVEKGLDNFSTEGASAKYYYDSNGALVLVETASFVSLARFFTSYYISGDEVFYINSITDEWDLKKLHGEHGELSSDEGEYVVGTTTREGYVVTDNKLCEYISDKQREASPAVTKSDPVKDSVDLLRLFETIINK